MANYMPLVYNLDDDPLYLPRTTISPLINPYFLSSNIGPFRRGISSLGTAADDLVLSPVATPPISPVIQITKKDPSNGENYTVTTSLIPPIAPIVPMNSQVQYLNVNNDPDLIRKVTKYFFEKTMNAWMYSDFEDLLTYLVVKNGKVSVVSNKKELENNKRDTDMKSIELKVNFITDHVMTKYDMKSFLKKYALKSGLDMWKLKENKSYVKKSIYKKIKNKLEKLAYH